MSYYVDNKKVGYKGERLKVKHFKTADAMHTFLNDGGNALAWQESNKGLKQGTYAHAGGKWHNVKSLDASALNHI